MWCSVFSVETPGASTLPVAFSAALTTTSTINAQQNVIFDKVITNVGNGYNKSSGKFTAPMKGLYFVSVTLFNFYHVSPTMELVQNDQNVVDLYLDGSGHQNSGMSQTLVLQLNKGDTISVRGKTDAGKLSGSSGQPTGTYNTFSGYCLTYME